MLTRRLRLRMTVLLMIVGQPTLGSAQGIGPTAAGVGAGLFAGGTITVAAMTVLAQDESYIWDWPDLMGWPALPILAGAIGGGIQGGVASDRLGLATAYAGLGAAAGAGLGWWLGTAIWGEERGRWAGLLVGAGAGVATGWVVGSLLGGDRLEAITSGEQRIEFRVPIGR